MVCNGDCFGTVQVRAAGGDGTSNLESLFDVPVLDFLIDANVEATELLQINDILIEIRKVTLHKVICQQVAPLLR